MQTQQTAHMTPAAQQQHNCSLFVCCVASYKGYEQRNNVEELQK